LVKQFTYDFNFTDDAGTVDVTDGQIDEFEDMIYPGSARRNIRIIHGRLKANRKHGIQNT